MTAGQFRDSHRSSYRKVLSTATRWKNAKVKMLWHGTISGSFEDLEPLIKQWDVDYIGMDSEPEVQLVGNFAQSRIPGKIKKGQVILCDEVILKGQDYRRVERKVQNKMVPMFSVHHSFHLDAVRDRIKRGLYHFPDIPYRPDDSENFIFQLLTNERGNNGRWTKSTGSADHYHHAAGFAEAATIISLCEQPKKLIFGMLDL